MDRNLPYADLHLHTDHSDGYCSSQEVVDKVAACGLKCLSIVDHDEVGALPAAIDYGKRLGIEVIPGVELSVSYRDYDLHVLAYGFDHREARLIKHLAMFKQKRVDRARSIVARLNGLGVRIRFEDVLRKSGKGTIGRPHIANVLVDNGSVTSFKEAFNRYIGNGRPAHVDKHKFDVELASDLIRSIGAVGSIAHPGLLLKDDDLSALIEMNLVDAIEVIHPKHDEQKIKYYRNIAIKHRLLQTGGSDFHGGPKGDAALGTYAISYDSVLELKRMMHSF